MGVSPMELLWTSFVKAAQPTAAALATLPPLDLSTLSLAQREQALAHGQQRPPLPGSQPAGHLASQPYGAPLLMAMILCIASLLSLLAIAHPLVLTPSCWTTSGFASRRRSLAAWPRHASAVRRGGV